MNIPSRRRSDDLLRIGLFWPVSRSVYPTAYLSEQNPSALDVASHQRLAQELENAGFDFGLLADSYAPVSETSSRIGHHDPSIHAVLWAMALFAVTSRIGLISTMHPTFIDVVDLAQYGAQLDFASGGRWGWNVTTGYRPDEPKLFGADGLADHEERYGIAEEAVSTVKQLWHKQHPWVSHHGKYRRLDGRLPGPSPVAEGGPVIVNAGASEQGLGLAGRLCDYLFAPTIQHADLARLTDKMEVAGRAAGREEFTRVLSAVRCFVRDDPAEAQDEWEVITASIAASTEVKAHTDTMSKGSKSTADALARGGSLGGGRADGLQPLVGTPESVAQELVALYRDFGYRGFLLTTPYWGPGEMGRFGRMFELLEDAGVWLPSAKRESLW